MLPVLVLLALCSTPGQTAGLAPFYDYLIQTLGLTRQQVANAYMFGTLCSGCVIPLGGRLIDRFGARKIALLAGGLMSTVLLALSFVDRMANAIPATIAPLAASMLVLIPLFALLRFSGQGLMTLCGQTTVGHWFNRRRGLAVGVNGVIMALVGSSAPMLIDLLMGPSGDWRFAWRMLALVITPSIMLIVAVFWRNTPEDCGLLPDGLPPESADSKHRSGDLLSGWTRREAIATRAFWNVALSSALLGLIITSFAFHLVDIGTAVGLSRTRALAFFIPFSITATSVGLMAGVVVDRITARPLVITMNVLLGLAMLVLTRFSPGFWFYAGALTLGAATGLAGPMGIATYPRFFGRRHLGAINGAQWTCAVVASAIGPSLFVALSRAPGDYDIALLALLPVPVTLALLATTLRTPTRP